MGSRKGYSAEQKHAALKEGIELPVDPNNLWHGVVGDVPPTDERAVLELASAIHNAESKNVAVSWSAQERAADYFNSYGLIATLDEISRLESGGFLHAPRRAGKVVIHPFAAGRGRPTPNSKCQICGIKKLNHRQESQSQIFTPAPDVKDTFPAPRVAGKVVIHTFKAGRGRPTPNSKCQICGIVRQSHG